MAGGDLYALLGVRRDATQDDIKSAYRKRARELHPDVNKAPDAKERFAELQQAYEVLSDEERRRRYDYFGSAEPAGAGPSGGTHQARYSWSNVAGGGVGGGGGGQGFDDYGDLGSMFDAFFGGDPSARDPRSQSRGPGGPGQARAKRGTGRKARPLRGEDITQPLAISFTEMITGGRREIGLSAAITGDKEKRLTVTVPAGVADGSTLRVRGAGKPAKLDSAPAGDLLLTIAVEPHPLLTRGRPDTPPADDARRSSLDLWLDVPITVAEAARGASVKIPAVSGGKLASATIAVPPGTGSGTQLRLRGRGIAAASGKSGDLYARVRIAPPELSDDSPPALIDALDAIAEHQPTPRTGPGWTQGA